MVFVYLFMDKEKEIVDEMLRIQTFLKAAKKILKEIKEKTKVTADFATLRSEIINRTKD